jgi:hypothetical protein
MDIKNNMSEWFKFYGIEKKYWTKYRLPFELMKEEKKEIKKIKGLGAWGI